MIGKSAYDGHRSNTKRTEAETELVYKSHSFCDLRGHWPLTAAAQVPLVIYRDIMDDAAQRVLNYHRDFFSLYVIRTGRGLHSINGVEFAVARGDVYIMAPGMRHAFRSGSHLTADTLHFAPEMFEAESRDALAATPGFHALFMGAGGSSPETPETGDTPSSVAETMSAAACRWMHLTPVDYERIASQVAELRAEWERGTPDAVLLTRVLFLRLLVHLSRAYAQFSAAYSDEFPVSAPQKRHSASLSRPAHPMVHDTTIATALHLMEERFDGPLKIEEVASAVYLSPDRFTEVFVAAMGRTPRDYLRHLRLERAKTLLATTDAPTGEVARLSGFGDAAYLTRVLRAATGHTPRHFRLKGAATSTI